MTNTFETAATQECTTSAVKHHVEMPCAGSNASIVLSAGEPTVFDFGLEDITGMKIVEGGMLLITFKDGQTLTVENFAEAAQNSEFQDIALADGEVINLAKLSEGLGGTEQYAEQYDVASINMIEPAAGNDNIIGKPVAGAENQALAVVLAEGQDYVIDFTAEDVETAQVDENGQLVITFKDGTTTTIENYSSFDGSASTPAMTLADGTVIAVTELLTVFGPEAQGDAEIVIKQTIEIDEDAPEGEEVQVKETVVEVNPEGTEEEEIALLDPEDLAAIEPAAGEGTPVGALGNTGADFGSSINGLNIAQVNAIGPIGPTALAFGLPELGGDERLFLAADPADPVLILNDAIGYEDTNINFGIDARPSTLDGSQSITVTISGIPAGWTPVTPGGTFNPGAGTWTISMPPGQAFNGPVFRPPVDSDADIQPLTVTVTQFDSPSGTTQTTSGTMNVFVDAVADPTNLTANDVTGLEDNPVAIDVQTSLNDIDGSEEITEVLISDVPAGFTFNAGTDLGGGVWRIPVGDLPTLEMTPPANYSGTLTLTVTVNNEELNFDGLEFDTTNNTNTNSTTFDVTFTAVADAPDLIADNPIIKEDGTGFLHVEARLQDTDGSERLVIKLSNIDPAWTNDLAAQGYTFDALTNKWVLELPDGVDEYIADLQFTPPADSDVDMNDIRVEATAIEASNGDESTAFLDVDILVDAVADQPTIDGDDIAGPAGASFPLNITNAATDTDGSETLGVVRISGLPAGFTLSAGTEVSPGVWEVSQADLAGLELNTPVTFNGSFTLNLSVTATESVTDGEVDDDDNDATATTTIDVVLDTVQPPTVDINTEPGTAGTGGWVYEDGTVFVPITAALSGLDNTEVLTVTVTNIDPSWTVETGPSNGTYDPATGTWTITLLPGQNYNGGLTFTPPADSDVDMTGLVATATSENPATGGSATATDTGDIIVDAVADEPAITADDAMGEAGTSVALNIANATTDTDGSEDLGAVTISGIPADYSLNAGVRQGNGDWIVQQSDLANLRLNIPASATDATLTLTASVTATEVPITDTDFDTTNDTATNSDTFTVVVEQLDIDPPTIDIDTRPSTGGQVYEDGTVFVPITAELQGDRQDTQVLTVTVTGIDPSWTVDVGAAGNGTYDAATGTWTITLPAGQDYNGGLQFTPPADSDIDMTGLVATATAEQTLNGETASNTDNGSIIVDAVADMPTLNVANANGLEGQSIDLFINAALTDTDGSEVLSKIRISGVPSGFSLNQGTDMGGGVWELTQAELSGLELNTPSNFSGSVPLTVSVTTTEQVAVDDDFDLTNNTATNTKTLNVVIADRANPPTLEVEGTHKVYEDGSVFVPFKAALTGDASEVLTVTVSGIPSGWTITTGPNNGTYDPATGTWTITMPAGQNYDGGLTFAPPADSDIDLNDLNVTATAFAPETNTSSSVTEIVQIITDAVADTPNVNAGSDVTVDAGDSVALNISNSLNDTDGSEVLGSVRISGVPGGFTLNQGTNLGGGVWEVTQAHLSGLRLNVPSGSADQNFNLTVRAISVEQIAVDDDFDLTNNTATNTDVVNVTVESNFTPPNVTFGAAGSGSAQVYEDGSVFVPITATLTGNAPQQLTVTLTGVPGSWTVTTGAANGTYNPATGTWTITLPAGQNYDGGLTFAPPADSDVDLTGLTVTATSRNTLTDETLSDDTSGEVIVDAVADQPSINAGSDVTADAGGSVALNISNSLSDTDGSETLGNVRISGVPSGFTLNQGTNLGGGVWEVTQAQLSGLRLNVPSGASDQNFNLTVRVTATEGVTDTDFDFTNNTATDTDVVNVTVTTLTPPTVTFGAGGSGSAQVYEDGSVFVPITATLTGNAPQQLTVTLTGVPGSWTVTTGAGNGTYNPATGTWTITLPAGQNYDGGLTFTPPADSDVDLTGLTVTATSRHTTTDETESSSTDGEVIVDAVADTPDVNAGSNKTVDAGGSVALNITNALNDTDGSETLGNVRISGVPSGFTLNQGTNLGGGVWEVTQAQLGGLRLNVPSGASNQNFNLTVRAIATEGVTDTDFDNTNNTATNTDVVNIAVKSFTPPTVTFGAGGSGSAQVYEDGSVFVPITATLTGTASQQLTVTLTGVPGSWTVTTGSGNGTYNPATGTWTITLPANQDYNGGLTFRPAPNSDVDLRGLTITATSRNISTNDTRSTDTSGQVIVDAVADMPALSTNSSVNVDTGSSVALSISAALTDTDSSESLSSIRISGVPSGFSLNKGTNLGGGVWELSQSQLSGLRLNAPANISDRSFNLTVSVTSTERVTDTDFDFTNNAATNNNTIRVNVDNNGPVARNDSVCFSECDWIGIGNVMTGFGWDGTANGGTNGGNADTPGSVGATQVSHVNGQAMKSGGDAMSIEGSYGTLYIFKDGTYTYVSEMNTPHPSQQETFTYIIRDAGGNSDSATLTITPKNEPTGRTTNPLAKYLDGASSYSDGGGSNMILGYDAGETIYGNGGNDYISGWKGNDVLNGGAGNDIVMGDHGYDYLYGGSGADMFVMDPDSNYGIYDRIFDFNQAQGDVIDFASVIENFNPATDAIGSFLRSVNMTVGGSSGSMIQVRNSVTGGDWQNAVFVADQPNINIQDLYNKGHIDVT